ncbi:hypothetical protein [[Pseudomonas] boreopolis]|uniref:hypothetical protein n=1 Tax=Xanthomonas boreopolis TaxID=86183 RepID=UPI003D9BC19D
MQNNTDRYIWPAFGAFPAPAAKARAAAASGGDAPNACEAPNAAQPRRLHIALPHRQSMAEAHVQAIRCTRQSRTRLAACMQLDVLRRDAPTESAMTGSTPAARRRRGAQAIGHIAGRIAIPRR